MTYDLKIERILDAPPDLVFDTIVDPAFKDEIFADLVEGWAPLRFDTDLRVGGFETEADRDSFEGGTPTWLDSVQRVVEARAAAAPEEGT